MHIRIAMIAAALASTACQSSPRQGEDAGVSLYQHAGSRQCERGGKTLEALRRELGAAGVEVRSASCGQDGRMYGQACGTADGRILVVQVDPAQAAAAARLGLKPLRELPEAVTVTCR